MLVHAVVPVSKLRINFFLTIVLLYFQIDLHSQSTWIKTSTLPAYEVGDIAIDSANNLFVSLKNTHHIFISENGGENWKDIWDPDEYFDPRSSEKNIKVIKNKFYYGFYKNNLTYLYSFENGRLTKSEEQRARLNRLKFDEDGNAFLIEDLGYGVYYADTNWYVNTKLPADIPFYYVINSFIYNNENNYIVTRLFKTDNELIKIFKLNRSTGNYFLYSSFFGDIRSEDIAVSKNGSICIYSYQNGVRTFFGADSSDPFNYKELILDSNWASCQNYFLTITQEGRIATVTGCGIYSNYEDDIRKWSKLTLLSNNLPLPDNYETDRLIVIKDSLNAISSFGDDCGSSSIYYFNGSSKLWKEAKLEVQSTNLKGLKVNRKGRLFAYKPCASIDNSNYYYSDNKGKDWRPVNALGFPIANIGINRDGEAIGNTGKRIFLHNSDMDKWEEIATPISTLPNLKMRYFFSSKQELFMIGDSSFYPQVEYLFHSPDAGRSWKRIKSINAGVLSVREPYFDILVDDLNQWVAFPAQSGDFNPVPVYFSKDKGDTWLPDPRFNKLREANNIVQLKDGRFLTSGLGKNKQSDYGTYISTASDSWSPLSDYFATSTSKFIKISDSTIFGFIDKSDSNPFICNIFDKNTYEDHSGIEVSDNDVLRYNSLIAEPNDRIYLSVAYNGIYTTNKLDFTDISEINKNPRNYIKTLFTSQDKVDIESWIFEVGTYDFDYKIYNNLGQLIQSKDNCTVYDNIDISALPFGWFNIILKTAKGTEYKLKLFRAY